MGHTIEGSTADPGLRGLCLQQARRQALTKDSFETEHGSFRQRAHMVARAVFPGFSSQFANGAQILIPFQSFVMCVAMLPDTRILTRRDQHHSLRSQAVESVIHLALVIAAIPGETINRLNDLLEQGFHHPGIIDAVFGQRHRFDLATFWIDTEMQLAPGAPFRLAMGSHLPFALPIDLQSSAIHDKINVPAGCLR